MKLKSLSLLIVMLLGMSCASNSVSSKNGSTKNLLNPEGLGNPYWEARDRH